MDVLKRALQLDELVGLYQAINLLNARNKMHSKLLAGRTRPFFYTTVESEPEMETGHWVNDFGWVGSRV